MLLVLSIILLLRTSGEPNMRTIRPTSEIDAGRCDQLLEFGDHSSAKVSSCWMTLSMAACSSSGG